MIFRTGICLAAAVLVSGRLFTASARTPAPSKTKLTTERLKEMRAKWSENKTKLKTCRKEVTSKGLAGDDRWFFIEDCMGKT